MALSSFLKRAKEINDEHNLARSRKEPAHPEPVSHDDSNWLVSYADMMTLLCAFFIMMFSMSKLNAPEYEAVRREVTKTFGGDYQNPTKNLADHITQVMIREGITKGAVVTSTPSSVTVVFQSSVFFESLSAFIKDEGHQVLNRFIATLQNYQGFKGKSPMRIVVEGHTDAQPIISGSYPSNWELSSARAARVVDTFIQNGYNPDQLIAVGYGATRPKLPNRAPSGLWDPAALTANRRVVVRILPPSSESIPWQDGSKYAEE